ncbi:MAG: alpha-galactosidase [Eubacteriales bacterium]|nr:alpha-galactosidase [Eubacteriales bacterium]
MEFLKKQNLFSFLYDGKNIWDCEVQKTVSENDNEIITELALSDGLKVTNIAKKHGDNAYEWVNRFENTGSEPTKILSDIWDCDYVIPFEKDEKKGHTAYEPDKDKIMKVYAPSGSTWSAYEFYADPDKVDGSNFLPYHLTPDRPHQCYQNYGGRSSDQRAPFFNLKRENKGVIFAIGWTGQWRCELDRTDEGVRIRTKVEDTHFRLMPGEKIRTSSIVIMPYMGTVIQAQNQWRRLVKKYFSLIGKPGRDKEGIFCAGVWGGMSDTGIKERVQKIKEYNIPVDDIWMDAGWYGMGKTPSPDEFEGDWSVQAGDWRANPYIHPNGLIDVSEEIADAGKKFLLWFEPERSLCSKPVAKEHPEYFLMPEEDDNEHWLLNLGDEAAWNYCFDTLAEFIEKLNLHYYRQDFNFSPLPYWRKNDTEDRVGISEIKHIMGLYRLWDALLERFPHLMIDNCASGGRRIDIETLRRSVPLWRSDAQCPANYRCEIAQMHNMSFASWMPYSGTGSGREWGDMYRIRSAYAGALTTNYSFSEKALFGNPEQMMWFKKMGEEYLKVRPYFYEDFYPLTQISERTDIWSAAQYDRPDKGDGIVQVFRREDAPYTDATFTLFAIQADKTYVFHDADTDKEVKISGKQLAEKGFSAHIPEKRTAKLYFYHTIQ